MYSARQAEVEKATMCPPRFAGCSCQIPLKYVLLVSKEFLFISFAEPFLYISNKGPIGRYASWSSGLYLRKTARKLAEVIVGSEGVRILAGIMSR